MDTAFITDNLNPQQKEAVTSDAPNVLVIAGAGSGKTRVLVHRMAWLIHTQRASSSQILAVTFTNKAAREIQERVTAILGTSMHHMWVGTFHSQCHKILRIHYQEAGLHEHFQIMDTDEQLRLIKKIHKEFNLADTAYPPKKSMHMIGNCKENMQHAHDLDNSQYDTNFIKVFSAYEQYCQQQSLLDFTDLLLRCYELLKDNQQILTLYQDRFKYILIDEFQDTNHLQYAWLKLIGAKSSMSAVGDDDQSIYSWRGAIVGHLHDFQDQFAHTQTIRLEQNYRSTSTILSAANALIEHNDERMGKNLWTDLGEGEPIKRFTAYNERDEAEFISQSILDHAKSHTLDEFAVFYRSNAQSRVIEETLNREGIPYRIWGGFRFFDRAEIKDCLAYVRLWLNPHDDNAFERVVNLPARGIGNSTLEKIRNNARQSKISLWEAAAHTELPARSKTALTAFIDLISDMTHQEFSTPGDLAEYIIDKSRLKSLYPNKILEHIAKIENMEELINAFSQLKDPGSVQENVRTFLAQMSLDNSMQSKEQPQKAVQLMTFHAAKGLEFPFVFMTGMEEGLFPHYGSDQDSNELEEERRLCYVGMTRAKSNLYIIHSETRRVFGKEQYQRPSRFISEIPKKYLVNIRSGSLFNTSSFTPTPSNNPSHLNSSYRLGSRVKHETFGEGTVLNIEGESHNLRIQVHFEAHGVKWLLSQYAKLQTI